MVEELRSIGGWKTEPRAEALLTRVLTDFVERSRMARHVRDYLLSRCGVRIRDVLDHVSFDDTSMEKDLTAAGWQRDGTVWHHPGGRFPDFIEGADSSAVAFACESLEQFAECYAPGAEIQGEQLAPLRLLATPATNGVAALGVERNGHAGYELPGPSEALLRSARLHFQALRARRRQFGSVPKGLDHTERLVRQAVEELGPHWACALFLKAEREYWMQRCEAGRRQYDRQCRAGIGWANIDHHTYDSSRKYFAHTIRILELLGYECRELMYAGDQAGWGSQILEQSAMRSTVFADIDLAPEELAIDFAHMDLPPLPKFRRAGIWCTLHGESMLEGGLNHVAGLYDQRFMRRILRESGVQMMAPFSDFPELYQELTQGEWWPVQPERVDMLEQDGQLQAAEAESFRLNGAIGSHLENIERNFGFKGFNQPGIDGVLRIIDPRRNLLSRKSS